MTVTYNFDDHRVADRAAEEMFGLMDDAGFRMRTERIDGYAHRKYLVFPKESEAQEPGKEIASLEFNGLAEPAKITLHEGKSEYKGMLLQSIDDLAKKFGGEKSSDLLDTLADGHRELAEQLIKIRTEAVMASAQKDSEISASGRDIGRTMDAIQKSVVGLLAASPEAAPKLRPLAAKLYVEGPHDIGRWAQSHSQELAALEDKFRDQKRLADAKQPAHGSKITAGFSPSR